MKTKLLALAGIALAFLITGCSSVSTGSDQVALHYEGGSLSSKKYKDCVSSSDRQYDGPGDQHYSYPTNQRNLVFPDKGDKTQAIKFVTKDGIEMTVTGVLNFNLNTSCDEVKVGNKTYKGGDLQIFHEKIGKRYKAYMDGDEDGEGWIKVLGIYLFKPLDTAIDRAGQQFTYEQLYNDPNVKAQWEQAVLDQLPDLVNRQTDGDVEFFQNFAITLQKPDPPKEIKTALLERQKALADADTAAAKANADKLTAEAQLAVSEAEAKKKEAEIQGYGGFPNYLQYFMAQQGLNPLQPVIIGSTAGQAAK